MDQSLTKLKQKALQLQKERAAILRRLERASADLQKTEGTLEAIDMVLAEVFDGAIIPEFSETSTTSIQLVTTTEAVREAVNAIQLNEFTPVELTQTIHQMYVDRASEITPRKVTKTLSRLIRESERGTLELDNCIVSLAEPGAGSRKAKYAKYPYFHSFESINNKHTSVTNTGDESNEPPEVADRFLPRSSW